MRIVFRAVGKNKPAISFVPATLDLEEGLSGSVVVLKNGSPAQVSNRAVSDARFTVAADPNGFVLTFVGPADAVSDIPVDVSMDVA